MKWYTLLLIFSLPACKTKGPACLIDATDILKSAPGKLITVKDSSYKITALYDAGWDSLKGGAYLFYPNEFLKSYTFYQNRQPVYSETYDEQGFLVSTKGSPMVDRVINELNNDSVYVQVYFFKMMKSYQDLNIRINDKASSDYILQNDTGLSNMKSVTFGVNISELNKINMYSRINYLDDCSKIEHILNDSLFLVKDPQNGLVPALSK